MLPDVISWAFNSFLNIKSILFHGKYLTALIKFALFIESEMQRISLYIYYCNCIMRKTIDKIERFIDVGFSRNKKYKKFFLFEYFKSQFQITSNLMNIYALKKYNQLYNTPTYILNNFNI